MCEHGLTKLMMQYFSSSNRATVNMQAIPSKCNVAPLPFLRC